MTGDDCSASATTAHNNQRFGLAACAAQRTFNNVNVAQLGGMVVDGPTYPAPSHLRQDRDRGGFATLTANQARAHTGIV